TELARAWSRAAVGKGGGRRLTLGEKKGNRVSRVDDVHFSISVGIRGLVALERRGALEEQLQCPDRIGDVHLAVRVGVPAHEAVERQRGGLTRVRDQGSIPRKRLSWPPGALWILQLLAVGDAIAVRILGGQRRVPEDIALASHPLHIASESVSRASARGA